MSTLSTNLSHRQGAGICKVIFSRADQKVLQKRWSMNMNRYNSKIESHLCLILLIFRKLSHVNGIVLDFQSLENKSIGVGHIKCTSWPSVSIVTSFWKMFDFRILAGRTHFKQGDYSLNNFSKVNIDIKLIIVLKRHRMQKRRKELP